MAAANGPAYDLGCIICGQPGLALPGQVFPETGTYTVWYCYAGTEVCIEFEGVEGEPFIVPIGNLGAPYAYTFHVDLPDDGGVFTATIDGDEWQCFAFCLKSPLVGEVVLLDMEGVTCANLNDEENGLTEEQRNDCILPGYDFADDDTFDALSPQQKADLTARLCTAMAAPYIKQVYADEAAALADITTVPLDTEAIRIKDSGRIYNGDSGKNSAQLIAAKKFTPGFTEDPALGLKTTFEGAPVNVQIF